ncbi:MAG: hypothetical protein KDB27_35000 [Planctomycetales bacterium]|nr:hypothetical protein [Planctomycetales bacterium]
MRRLSNAALMLAMCAIFTLVADAAETDLRLQIEWWGGDAQAWDGLISIDQGRFSHLKPLGLDESSSGSIFLRRRQLIVEQAARLTYNGATTTVTGNEDSKLRIEFVGSDDTSAKVFSVTLRELAELTNSSKSFSLDASGNKIWIKRVPGDDVRVSINRPHLVFEPGEEWSIDVLPHHLPDKDRDPQRCRFATADANGTQLWSESLPLQKSIGGTTPPLKDVAIKVPEREGVYTLTIEVIAPERRFTPPFRSERTVGSRSVQFVVIEENRPPFDSTADRVVFEINPAEDRWWDRLTLLPQWSILPGLRHDGPLSNRSSRELFHGARAWSALPVGGWQAFPLPVEDVGTRHELTIEYPGDLPQTTSFSIVEPNAAGKVLPIELDSGINVSRESAGGIAARPPQVSKHVIPFWPNTKSPLLLVTNLNKEQESVIGQIRVERVGMSAPSLPANRSGRKLIANFDRPLFLENFSASERLNPDSARTFEDWATFYEGGRRMVEHLRHNGYDGVSLTCSAEGSSLYWDDLIHPTPKYDRGIFFSDGRDPVRKDIMEMLFRLCDREHLTLVPSFEFSTRLHVLEQTLRSDRNVEGIRLVDSLGNESSDSSEQSSASHAYNPLDLRVQEAILTVIRNAVRRYGRHPSFGGVQLNLTQTSFTQLPGIEWGMDRNTLRRFRTETGVPIPDPMTQLEDARAATLQTGVVDKWEAWRCQQLASLYGRVQDEVEQESKQALLYVSLSNLLVGEAITSNIQESLSSPVDVARELSRFGIDLQLLSQQQGLVVPRPQQVLANADLIADAAQLELNHSDNVESQFRSMRRPATQFHHEPIRLRLSSFDEQSPFGKDKTFVSLVAHVASSGVHYRERFAHGLAQNDSLILMDGGWMLPLGQEESLRAFAAVYRAIPAARFRPINNKEVAVSPLVVRTLKTRSETFFYMVNDSPWNVAVDLQFTCKDKSLKMRSLGLNRSERLEPSGDNYVWSLNVEQFGLVAVAMSSPAVELVEGQAILPPDVNRGLEQRINALNSRARYLAKPIPFTSIENGDFEQPSSDVSIPAWVDTSRGKNVVTIATGYNSDRSIQVSAIDRRLTVSSREFESPQSGKIAISFLARHLRHSSPVSRAPKPSVALTGLRVTLERGGTEVVAWQGSDFKVDSLQDGWEKVILPLRDVDQPKGSPDKLALRFDVSPDTDIQIDDIRVYDSIVMDSKDLRALSRKIIPLADYMRRNGFYGDCNRFLNSYWPQYLMAFVPESPTEPPAVVRRPPPRPKAPRSSSRWKQYIPRLPKFR